MTSARSSRSWTVEAWVTCWTDIPDDGIASDAGGELVPGGRWLIDLLVPILEKHGARVAGIGFEYSGYWWMYVDQDDRRFLLFVYYASGIGNICVKRRRDLAGWLLRRDFAGEVLELAKSVVQGLDSDPRVQRAALGTGYVER